MQLRFQLKSVSLFVSLSMVACAPARFQTIVGELTNSSLSASGKIVERFDQAQGAGKVDILIVNDNSASMSHEQSKLGQRFGNFIGEISDIDFQIAMTTTDIDGTHYNLDGGALEWANTGTKIMTPSTPGAALAFQQTIERQETLDCLNSGICASGNEQALGAMIRAISHRNDLNAGFFRADAPLAIVVLSDEDEMSTGASGTSSQQVLNAFRSAFGNQKRLAVHGIIVKPGDTACRDEQRSQVQGAGYYGTRVAELASLTGGKTMSICDTDYSQSLTEISHEFRSLVTTFDLSEVPDPASVEVLFTPAQSIGYQINGNRLTLNHAAPLGTKIEVRYFKR